MKVFHFDRLPESPWAEQSDFGSDTEWDQLSDYGSHYTFIEMGVPGTNRADSKICLLDAVELVQLALASKRSWRLAARVALIAGRVVHNPLGELSQASHMAFNAAAVGRASSFIQGILHFEVCLASWWQQQREEEFAKQEEQEDEDLPDVSAPAGPL